MAMPVLCNMLSGRATMASKPVVLEGPARARSQLIEATTSYRPRRQEPREEERRWKGDIARKCDTFLKFEESAQSKTFPRRRLRLLEGRRRAAPEHPRRRPLQREGVQRAQGPWRARRERAAHHQEAP